MWLKNLPLKLTALGLAVFLWFHVATNRTYDYPREVVLEPGVLPHGYALATPIPNRANLLFSGTGKELLRLMWEDASATLLLEPHMSGVIQLTADRLLAHADARVEIAQVIEPTAVEVHVDTVISRLAGVRLQGEFGTQPSAALTATPRIVPDRVTVSGPRTTVENLAAVRTVPFDAGTLESNLTKRVALDLSEDYNVSADPDSVDVVFEVAPRTVRTISAVRVELPQGWRADPVEVTLQISGAKAVLDSLKVRDCRVTVEWSERQAADSLVPVNVQVPALVEVQSVAPAMVKVTKR